MANAKRSAVPNPKDSGQPHGNKAPFSPQKLDEVAPGGSMNKGTVTSYFTSEACEKGTGDAKPVWP